ncbi:DUF6804 family protein [Flavobacterium sp. Sd200]|uniref:DUF6804 family protein n=1 Tax=Flavobacterium sp. Sd200 TaxID=2692211 RepID=UPI00351AD589
MSLIKPICFASTILLLLAIHKMPIGYYTFLRLAITLSCITIITKNIKTLHALWIILFVVTALLFNPLIPVYFYKKSLWLPIDIVCALIFLCYGIIYKANKNTLT